MFVSVSCGKGLVSVLLSRDGKIVSRRTERSKVQSDDNYILVMDAFSYALRLLRDYMQTENLQEYVVFELSNSLFIGWLKKGYAKEKYQEKFIEVERLLNELPIQYSTVFSKKPAAKAYLSRDYLIREKITGLEV